MIILISGLKRSGKNTVADCIVDTFAFDEYAFADPIKEMCAIAFNWDETYFEVTIKKESIDPEWGISPRQALQWLGTEGFQFGLCQSFPEFQEVTGRHIWVDRFVKLFKKGNFMKDVVITDNRFPHEISIIKEKLPNENVLLIKVRRGDHFNTDMHFSEIEIEKLPYDILIENNGSMSDLYTEIEEKIIPHLKRVR